MTLHPLEYMIQIRVNFLVIFLFLFLEIIMTERDYEEMRLLEIQRSNQRLVRQFLQKHPDGRTVPKFSEQEQQRLH